MLKFKLNCFLILSHFDDVFGPQIIDLYPKTQKIVKTPIGKVLSNLFDVTSVIEENRWNFLYSDKTFTSQNMRLTLLDDEGRGGITDFLISIVLIPTYSVAVAAAAMSWNSLFLLESKLLHEGILKENFKIKDLDYDKLEVLLETTYLEIKESLEVHINFLEPDVFEIL